MALKRLKENYKFFARLYVEGKTLKQIAERANAAHLGRGTIDEPMVSRALRRPEVQQYLALLQRSMEEKLGDLEHEAAAVAGELLYEDDPDIRYKIATDLLNRAGRRGKPIEQSISLPGDLLHNPEQALANILGDPGMQRLLDAQPTLRRKLLPAKEIVVESPDYVPDDPATP